MTPDALLDILRGNSILSNDQSEDSITLTKGTNIGEIDSNDGVLTMNALTRFEPEESSVHTFIRQASLSQSAKPRRNIFETQCSLPTCRLLFRVTLATFSLIPGGVYR